MTSRGEAGRFCAADMVSLRHAVGPPLPLAGFPKRRSREPGAESTAGTWRFQSYLSTGATIPYGRRVRVRSACQRAVTMNIPVFAVDLNLRTPYVHNYNLNLQHERPGTVVQNSYVGSNGGSFTEYATSIRLPPRRRGNSGVRSMRSSRNCPSSTIAAISANSNYNALQMTIKQRPRRRFQSL